MSKPRRTSSEFIELAKKKHNGAYDYSNVRYTSASKKVKIVCRIHGEFQQTPVLHLRGSGCPKCGGAFMDTDFFIEKAQKIHENKYDYSEARYVASKEKITILCNEHGVFKQFPNSHLNGQGCPKCGGAFMDTDFFIDKAREVHSDKYDYTLTEYTQSNLKLNITCNEHGIFKQLPSAHLSGQGCPRCLKKTRLSTIRAPEKLKNREELFIAKAKKVHTEYEYTKVNYINSKTGVDIICPIHGVFNQSPKEHLRGSGCRRCSNDKMSLLNRLTNSEFIQRALNTHGYKYDYSKSKYEKNTIKVKIGCRIHGEFIQAPLAHLRGSGCPMCSNNNFKMNKPATMYYILDPKSGLYKIGITNRTLADRFGSYIDKIVVLFKQQFQEGKEAFNTEQMLLEEFSDYRVLNNSWPKKLGGKTEFFDHDVLEKYRKENNV